MTPFRWRFLWPVSLGTVVLVALCAFTAVSLFQQQATITGVLRKNVSGARAASHMRACLDTLVALEVNRVESVADLHTRAHLNLAAIRLLATHPTERELSARMDDGFARYIDLWQALPARTDPAHADRVAAATLFLKENVLFPCNKLESFYKQQVGEDRPQLRARPQSTRVGNGGDRGFGRGGRAGVRLRSGPRYAPARRSAGSGCGSAPPPGSSVTTNRRSC